MSREHTKRLGEFLRVNENGHLEIDGLDTVRLAETYGTPLFVYSERTIRSNYKRLYDTLRRFYPRFQIHFSVKANISPSLLKVLQTEGAGADVGSSGELYVALLVGIDPSRITCNGPNKSEEFIMEAVKSGSLLCVDNMDELELISKVSKRLNESAKVLVRVKPLSPRMTRDIYYHVKESKFGMPFEIAYEAFKKALGTKNVEPVGLHFHIGTQILGADKAIAAAETMEFAAKLKENLGVNIEFLDVGGGLPVTRPYGYGMGYGTDAWKETLKHEVSLEKHIEDMASAVKEKCEEHGLAEPTIIVEPGRYLLATAGILLCRICKIKREPGAQKRIMVDANVNIMPYVRYKFYFHPVIANKAAEPLEEKVWICGNLCSWDFEGLYKDVEVPRVERGDILAFLDVGAYAETWADQWMGFPRPAAILANGGDAEIIRERETIQDLIAKYRIPSRLLTCRSGYEV
ncbi:diaminopimelate decarboxylase [Candidatus Bathyarchaeota archaeon]|nr:diaminopimelate decarboxylase [Candidatus Bathyarchaeota archaeon]